MKSISKTLVLLTVITTQLVGGWAEADQMPLVWSTLLGGSRDDECSSIALDWEGNVYVTGWTNSVDFPATSGAFDATHNDSADVFVVKLDAGGKTLIYATFLGGNNWDQGHDIALGSDGSAYVTGNTRSTDFPVLGGFDVTHNGNFDAFVVKLDPGGSALLYATFLGGRGYDRSNGIAVDADGSAYVTGWTHSEDFPTTLGAFCANHHGHAEEDAFVAKLRPSGGALDYATLLGGTEEDWGRAIDVDDLGHAYAAVLTYSPDIPTTSSAFDDTYNGSREAYVAKFDPSGGGLIYATFLGGVSQDWTQGIAVDDAGHVYLAGVTFSADFPTTAGAFDSTQNGGSDIFMATLDPTGGVLIYSTFMGGSGGERSTDIAIDGSGNACITGWTTSADFPTTSVASDTSFNGQTDAFVAIFNPWGKGLAYASFLGGSQFDGGSGVSTDGADHVFVVGKTRSQQFPTTAEVYQPEPHGGDEGFVTKLDLGGLMPANR